MCGILNVEQGRSLLGAFRVVTGCTRRSGRPKARLGLESRPESGEHAISNGAIVCAPVPQG